MKLPKKRERAFGEAKIFHVSLSLAHVPSPSNTINLRKFVSKVTTVYLRIQATFVTFHRSTKHTPEMYIHRRGNTASTYNHTDAASLCIYYIEAGRTLVPSSAKLLHLWNFELQERAIVQGQGSCHVPPPPPTTRNVLSETCTKTCSFLPQHNLPPVISLLTYRTLHTASPREDSTPPPSNHQGVVHASSASKAKWTKSRRITRSCLHFEKNPSSCKTVDTRSKNPSLRPDRSYGTIEGEWTNSREGGYESEASGRRLESDSRSPPDSTDGHEQGPPRRRVERGRGEGGDTTPETEEARGRTGSRARRRRPPDAPPP